MPMNSIDRIRALAGAGQFGAKAIGEGLNNAGHPSGIDIGGSGPRQSAMSAMAMAANRAFANPAFGKAWRDDSPAPAAPMDPFELGFNDSMAPKLQPMLPPDSDLNTPVQYNPITGSGYVQSPKRSR